MQQAELLCDQQIDQKAHTGDIATGPIETRDEAEFDWIAADHEYDRDSSGRCRGCLRRGGAASHGDHRCLTAKEFGYQCRHLIVLTLGPAIFDFHVLAIDISALREPFEKGSQQSRQLF